MDSTIAVTAAAPKLRVFLVEGSAPMLERLAETVTAAGACAVGRASTAAGALRGILAERPDVVMLDIVLGEGSGVEVLRRVAREAPEIDVFMLTNHAGEPYRRLCSRLGARRFFDKSTEFARVREALAERTATRGQP